MAGTTGLEPATSDVTGRRSNQLNYVPGDLESRHCLAHARQLPVTGLEYSMYNRGMSILRADPALDRLVAPDAVLEKIAGGFEFTEGPIWMRDNTLVFSDIPANTIYRYSPPDGRITEFLKPSGMDETGWPAGAFVGSNGLTLDASGRLVLCEHGNRRVTRLEADGTKTVLADRFEGKRLNSPNDAVFKSDGSLYFTDPPYGLVGRDADRLKELLFQGVFRVAPNGELQLIYDQLPRPNGLAFSPDERVFYVANSDSARKIWMRFDAKPDGSIANGEVFYDATADGEPGVPDGMKVDLEGNLYCTGPHAVWIFNPSGKLLGKIRPPEIPANLHWGDEDARTLYITARTGLYRIRMLAQGLRP